MKQQNIKLNCLKDDFQRKCKQILNDKTMILDNDNSHKIKKLIKLSQSKGNFDLELPYLNIAFLGPTNKQALYINDNLAAIESYFLKYRDLAEKILQKKSTRTINIYFLPYEFYAVSGIYKGKKAKIFSLADIVGGENYLNLYIMMYEPFSNSDRLYAYLGVIIHEYAHYLIRKDNPHTLRILDEGLVVFIQHLIFVGEHEKIINGKYMIDEKFLSRLTNKFMAFDGPFIDNELFNRFSDQRKFKRHIEKCILHENFFYDKNLEDSLTNNFKYVSSIISMFNNYIISRLLVGYLIIVYKIKPVEISRIKDKRGLENILSLANLTINQLGKELYTEMANSRGITAKDLSLQLKKYYL